MPEFWRVASPTEWPHGPGKLSPSSVADIESCPRRYGLTRAVYGPPIDGRYPPKPSPGSLRGQVVHRAMEDIVDALDAASATTPASAVQVLRPRGGITHVIEEAVCHVLAKLASNPRAADRMAVFEESLSRDLASMRQMVQSTLQRLLGPDEARLTTSGHAVVPAGKSHRRPLGFGFHTEVPLEPEGLDWVGIADAIRVTPETCEIIDHKTGAATDKHAEQLRIYALLWARDEALNPDARPADLLTLIYPTGTSQVKPPTLAELDDLELSLGVRLRAARSKLETDIPRAHVAFDNCRYCGVKQLCSDYWQAASRSKLVAVPEAAVRSIQVVLRERRARGVWAGVIQWDIYFPPGAPVVVRFGPEDRYSPGNAVRLIDVVAMADDSSEALSVEMRPGSEAFLLA